MGISYGVSENQDAAQYNPKRPFDESVQVCFNQFNTVITQSGLWRLGDISERRKLIRAYRTSYFIHRRFDSYFGREYIELPKE